MMPPIKTRSRAWGKPRQPELVTVGSVIARSRAPRGDEAIQLDRHGAPRDDNPFENTS
jgi:hypothetical protein